MEIQRAKVPFALHTSTTAKKVTFEGYASVFGTLIDTWVPTRILPGAFTKTIRDNLSRIKILWQHDLNEPIGIPLELREDPRGLRLRAQLSTTRRALEAAELLRDGVITEMSIGFDPVNYSLVDEGSLGQVRHISELQLWEVSLVTHAANRDATITGVHSRPMTIAEQLDAFDRVLAAHDLREAQRREAKVRELELALLSAGVRRR